MPNGKLFAVIIDDDEDDIDLLGKALQSTHGFGTIKSFHSGIDALEFMKASHNIPDIVITDLKMPLLSGFDVLNAINGDARLGALPVAIFSTSSYEEDISKAKVLGAVGFITKPYDYKGFEAITEAILALLQGKSIEGDSHLLFVRWFV